MRRSSSELKAMARRAMLGNYGVACSVMIFAALLGIGLNLFWGFFRGPWMTQAFLYSGVGRELFLSLLSFVFSMALQLIFLTGEIRICWLACSGVKPRTEDAFFMVSNHPLRFVGLWLIFLLISFAAMIPAWIVSIVIVVVSYRLSPGSVGSVSMALGLAAVILVWFLGILFVVMRYSMALIAMVEDPERGALECLRRSRIMMRGNVLRLLRLWLSFIGIFLLGYVSLGVGFLWIAPYMASTVIYFYKDCEAEAFPPRPSFEETDFWGNYGT